MSRDARYYSATALHVAGLHYRTLDFWVRGRLFTPTIEANGAGSDRIYTHDDLVALRALATLRCGRVQSKLLKAHTPALMEFVRRKRPRYTIEPYPGVRISVDLKQCRRHVDKALTDAPARKKTGRKPR